MGWGGGLSLSAKDRDATEGNPDQSDLDSSFESTEVQQPSSQCTETSTGSSSTSTGSSSSSTISPMKAAIAMLVSQIVGPLKEAHLHGWNSPDGFIPAESIDSKDVIRHTLESVVDELGSLTDGTYTLFEIYNDIEIIARSVFLTLHNISPT